MANVCNKCGNNLYGNKTKCPFCGEPIRSGGSYTRTNNNNSYNRTSNNSYNRSSNSNLSSKNYANNNTYNGYNNNNNYQRPSAQPRNTSVDTGGAGWGLLGFCIPIVGIVLYLVWQDERPYTAKACLNGALISILVGFVFGLFSACGSMVAY